METANINHLFSEIFFIKGVKGICNFLGSVSLQQKFEETDGPDLQLSFIWQAKENASSRHEGGLFQKIQREKRPVVQFWLLFIYFFSPPLSLPFVNWASKEGYLFHLRFSLWSSDLSFFYFRGLFPSLSCSHHHSGLLFPILTT